MSAETEAGLMGRRVIQVTPYYPPALGGLERVVAQLSQELAHRHEVHVVTTGLRTSGLPRHSVEDGVHVHRLPAIEVANTAISALLPVQLAKARPGDVVHLHIAHALVPELVSAVAALRHVPYVAHFHLDVDASGPLGRLLPWYKQHFLGRVLRRAVAVVALTEEMAEFLVERYGVSRQRLHIVPNGVSDAYFLPPRPAPARPLRLLFVGRLQIQKNVARLLDAMAQVQEDVRLRIVGDGELREPLVAQAARLGLRNVEFVGALYGDDLVKAYADSDAFVLPSDKEGMPLVLLEAMASGLPVIATDVPGNRELVDGTGLLAAPDPAALARRIDELAADAELWRSLAERSARTAAGLSWSRVAERVEQVYTEALA
ncbi:glycosyltransferase family 4 protein [Streptomyces sp. NBC_01352]|uniref:glycosyltransferase family 4 protein n=1 Tax=Streptomyces sp. NBC_01352 TaxID=2903834 RepID=UPI002E34F222|nr:glycosyltransferase family 4 protein [Streptomyces sp. NBC_01352]